MSGWPKIIQGGMGAGVSSWRLARAVSSLGQLGVVSGIALDTLLARRLQDGDSDGSIRRALQNFPVREMAERIWQKYFVDGGKPAGEPYKPVPMHSVKESRSLAELCIVGNFVEVFLAREGHDNPVGINYLEKIQLPHLPSIYGAMLAGVTCVLMGAGIATRIPGVLDRLANHEPASYELQVTGNEGHDAVAAQFDPADFFDGLPPLARPSFFPIVSSNALASTMLKRSNGRVDGFIVEGPTAGGHNAPPRGQLRLNDAGEPQYGDRDEVDLEKLRELGLPFWLAGGRATREKLAEALERGAVGVQVGTAFAFCAESGLRSDLRQAILDDAAGGRARVVTDRLASPTGFPFKVAQRAGTLSDPAVYESRKRVCDLGFLREVYRSADGKIGYRCPAEPVEAYLAKGGTIEATEGRKCLCNALLANVGQGQLRRDGTIEAPLVTAGDDLRTVARFIRPGESGYTAKDVIDAIV
ncbi:MAG: nitronate monooxygenase [Acidobacteria bacterium]|nr:nitronate monooxygenase [Acidobacteriota bacterium]